jgi:hypothetical protein
MSFRLVLQPAMALIFAIRDGVIDAREGRPPHFWALLTNQGNRGEIMRSGWKAVGRVFILAIIMDCIYQLIVIRWIYPLEALLTAILLAILPYLLVRGPVDRIARHWTNKSTSSPENS